VETRERGKFRELREREREREREKTSLIKRRI